MHCPTLGLITPSAGSRRGPSHVGLWFARRKSRRYPHAAHSAGANATCSLRSPISVRCVRIKAFTPSKVVSMRTTPLCPSCLLACACPLDGAACARVRNNNTECERGPNGTRQVCPQALAWHSPPDQSGTRARLRTAASMRRQDKNVVAGTAQQQEHEESTRTLSRADTHPPLQPPSRQGGGAPG